MTDTARKILDVAAAMFAEHGLNGTPVRRIAEAAQVNLAAINYHFTNKKNLYLQVLIDGFTQMETAVRSFATQHPELGFVDMAAGFFDILNDHKMQLRNSFRMILSSDTDFAGESFANISSATFGPPGIDVLQDALRRDLACHQAAVAPAQITWAARTVYAHLTHIALVMQAPYVQAFAAAKGEHDYPSLDLRRQDIREHAGAVLGYVQSRG